VARIDTLIVARDRLFREDFSFIVEEHFAVVGAESLDECLEEIAHGLRPRLLVIESAAIHFASLQRIRTKVPGIKTVLLMDSDQAKLLKTPAQCDIDGCIPADISPETLKLSLGLIIAGQAVMPSRLASALYYGQTSGMRRFLTPRECDLLRLLCLGRLSKEIARELRISAASVKVGLNVLLHKLDVGTRTEAAVWAYSQLAGSLGSSRPCRIGGSTTGLLPQMARNDRIDFNLGCAHGP
jgi:DNA-binding NarL/FixJ family response regulator